MKTHRRAISRSLVLHREVARRILECPELVDRARARVTTWLRDGVVHEYYAKAWQGVLRGTPGEVADAIVEESEFFDALRQVSPFAGTIDSRTRWRLLKTESVAATHEAS
jgi:hypothetical protein